MTKQHLFIHSPAVALAARVNAPDGLPNPLSEIPFDTVTSGAFSNVLPNMTLLAGSTAGADDLGRQRIRAAAAANTLYVGRSSQNKNDGELLLSDNSFLTVVADRRVWAKIPYIDANGVVYKDEAAYTDQNSQNRPKAVIAGGAVAATISGGIITVDFDGSGSYAVADGATISTYSWNVADGTITAGAGTSQITATFPAGFRYIKLTVTDSNGKTDFMETAVLADNPAASLCVAFQCLGRTWTADGQTAAFRILQDLDIDAYPDGTFVIFWEGEPSSASDRSNVKFWGWHDIDQNNSTATNTATLNNVVLECLDVAGRLARLPGFPQIIHGASSPSTWLEMLNPNMDKYLDYLLRHHSNALELAPFTPSGTGSAYPFIVLSSGGDNLWEQVQNRARALVPDYKLTCNSHGELAVIVDPTLQATADRTATSQATITASHWLSVDWTHTRPPVAHWVHGEGVVASASTYAAVFSKSPGTTPGQGENAYTIGEQLTPGQTELNINEGNRYAKINRRNQALTIGLTQDYGIDPAALTWVTLTVDEKYTRRKLGFSSARGLPVELAYSYNYKREGRVDRVDLRWEEETSGPAAVTYIPPTPDHDPPWTPPPNPFPTPTPPGAGTGLGELWAMTADVLAVTPNFGAASPSYSALATAGVGEDFWDFIIDPYAVGANGFLMTNNGLKKSENLDGAGTFSDVLTLSEMESDLSVSGTLGGFFQIKGSINQQGFFAFGLHDFVSPTYGNLYVYVTTDGGNTWTPYLVHNLGWGQARYSGAIEIAPRLSGSGQPIIYMASGISYFYRSTTGGQTWSQLSSSLPTTDFQHDIHVPYNDNASNNYILLACQEVSGAGGKFGYAKSTDGGSNWSTITFPDAFRLASTFKRTPFQSWTQDRLQLYAFGGSTRKFWRSNDFGSNWDLQYTFGDGIRAAGGFPYNSGQFYVMTTAGILVTIDGGVSWLNKTGNWSWGFNYAGNALNGATIGGAIVPNWLE